MRENMQLSTTHRSPSPATRPQSAHFGGTAGRSGSAGRMSRPPGAAEGGGWDNLGCDVPPPLPAVGDPSTGERLFLRVERETLRRFPNTDTVLFTIRTYIRPLAHLAARPEDAARLADALANLPDDVADYKRVIELSDAARHWLTSIVPQHDLGGSKNTSDAPRVQEDPS